MKSKESAAYLFLFLIVILLTLYTYHLRGENNELTTRIEQISSNNFEPEIIQDNSYPVLSDSLFSLDTEFNYLESNNTFKVLNLSNKPHLIIVFTPDDCSFCFSEAPFWEQLATVFGDKVTIIGVISGVSKENAKIFVRNKQINIPVIFDQHNFIKREAELDKTSLRPTKILIDKNRKIIHRAGSTYNNKVEQVRYVRTLQNLLGQI